MSSRSGSSAALMAALATIVASGCSGGTAKSGVKSRGSACIPPALNSFASEPSLPKPASTSLESSIRSRFAIFRRSPRQGDQPRTSNPGGGGGPARMLGREYELSSYYPVYIRRLPVPPAPRRSYVVPAYGRPETVPPARCFDDRIWGSGARRRSELVQQEHRRKVEPVACVLVMGGEAGSPGGRKAGSPGGRNANLAGCTPFAQIESGAAAFGVSDFHGEPAIGLVPDGVATLRLTYSGIAPILVRVRENVFALAPPKAPANRLDEELTRLESRLSDAHLTQAQLSKLTVRHDRLYLGTYPLKVEWLDRAGKPIRTISRSQAEASEAATSVGNLRAPAEASRAIGG
jgi:hypothetical protein